MPCINCKSEWIVVTKGKGMKNKTCEECYAKQVEQHQEYHRLQDEAKEYLSKDNINSAISNLVQAKNLRNDSVRFHGKLSFGHDYFTNQFIDNLISMIFENKNDYLKCVKLWDEMFQELNIGD